MIALFYDTETTGLPLFNEPSEDSRQPHIVQIAALLVDLAPSSASVVGSLNLIVRPDGWEIPDDVAAIHRITTEHARECGVPEEVALRAFMHLYGGRTRIAHNEPFDARIIRIALKRYLGTMCETWSAGTAECTQRLSTPIMQLPPTERMLAAGRTHYKSPNLREAHRHFTGLELDGAHDASVDVHACLKIYLAISRGAERKSGRRDAAD